MHGIAFIQDLAVVMIIAGLVTVLFHRFRQPVVLGYILAGLIIGPHTPPSPLIHDQETIQTLAELGMVFLMFSLGLEFSLRKLRQVGLTAFIAATLEILLMIWVGYEIGRMFGWSTMDSLFLGAMLSISSTTIIIKALSEMGKAREPFADLIFGILIVEDILAIALIALLSGIATSGSLHAADVVLTLGKLGVFLAAALVVGLLTVPRLLGYVARFKSNEVLLVMVLGLCFGVCLLTVQLGYSIALGAFLIGATMAEAREIGAIERLTEPIRDMFSAVFFVAIGLMIDPKLLVDYAVPILVITFAVVVGKVLACSFGTFVAGHDTRTSLRVGMGLAQIGEFSFIIASLGLSLKATSEFLYPIAVTVSALTTLLTPYLIKGADGLSAGLERAVPRPVGGFLRLYTQWVGSRGRNRPRTTASALLRRWTWQMGLNVALIVAIFAGAAILANGSRTWFPEWVAGWINFSPGLWLVANILSLPLYIATFRKFQSLGLLVAELTVNPSAAGERTTATRFVIAQAIPLAGLLGLALLVLALSSSLLPPLKILILLGCLIALTSILLWRGAIRIYARAQYALVQTFSQPPPPRAHAPTPPVLHLLSEAQLQTVAIRPGSPGSGKLISELRLRSHTGASIVALQRNGAKMINPRPEEEIHPGDQLLLLGSATQLQAAQTLLDAHPETSHDHPSI